MGTSQCWRALALVAVVAVLGCSADTPAREPAGRAGAPALTSPTTTTTPSMARPAPVCVPDPSLATPPAPPPVLVAALAPALADPRLAGTDVGVSIWVDGYGEVAAVAPDRPLLPASNEKLFAAAGALAVLGAESTFTTTVVGSTPVGPDGTLGGNLVLVAGGDPSLSRAGAHSLDALAAQVRAAGVTTVQGSLQVDESRYDTERRAPGWQDWQVPEYAGTISALMVDRNRWRRDAAFLADPAIGNIEAFRAALARHGVTILGSTSHGPVPQGGTPVASLTSAPVGVLVTDMMMRSDNMVAEMLVKETGLRARGAGTTVSGLEAATAVVEDALCTDLTGTAADGSGLSRANLRSARELRVIVQGTRGEPWRPLLDAALPLAGRSGTLQGRFRGTPAEGNVRAKTGTIIGGVALTGYGTTAGGRAFAFSVLANGPSAAGAPPAIDALVATVAADAS